MCQQDTNGILNRWQFWKCFFLMWCFHYASQCRKYNTTVTQAIPSGSDCPPVCDALALVTVISAGTSFAATRSFAVGGSAAPIRCAGVCSGWVGALGVRCDAEVVRSLPHRSDRRGVVSTAPTDARLPPRCCWNCGVVPTCGVPRAVFLLAWCGWRGVVGTSCDADCDPRTTPSACGDARVGVTTGRSVSLGNSRRMLLGVMLR